MEVIRIIKISGPDEWVKIIEKILELFLSDGIHNFIPGTVEVKTLAPDDETCRLYFRGPTLKYADIHEELIPFHYDPKKK